jgi:autotransporter strand-loop-strand O-heptosyltransferase
LEYDNLPHPIQYRQTFLERIRDFDAVIIEYSKDSSLITNENPYCATYIFSIRTDIAVRAVDIIKTKNQFFCNKPDSWQLEKNFLNSVRKVTGSIYVCKYIPNDNELNMQAVWNRDGINRNGTNIQFYLAVDDDDNLFLHIISDANHTIEITYSNYKKFHNITKKFLTFNLGKYQIGYTVRVYHQGIEIFNEFIGDGLNKFRSINKLIRNTNKIMNEKPSRININFIDGPFVEILYDKDRFYHVQFINKRNDNIEFELDLKNNNWAKCSKKYYIDWIIKIKGIDNDFYLEKSMDLKNLRVLICFESKSIGDTIAWIPYVEKFRIDKQCEIICSTFHNNLLSSSYPAIQFVNPGTIVHNIHALYRIGVFHNDKNEIDYTKHLTDPKKEPLTKVASDILGLEYEEIKPILPQLGAKKKKLVSIAVHGTAQCKYWNNPTGWQEVVDYLNDKGYEVKLLSKEEDGYMGNKNPKNATKMPLNSSIEEVLKTIQESKLFIGISSGLAWLAWGSRIETILISGFTDDYTEPSGGIKRIINKNVCNSCWNKYDFNPGDWNWCPDHKGTNRQFECSKMITSEQVIKEIKSALKIK